MYPIPSSTLLLFHFRDAVLLSHSAGRSFKYSHRAEDHHSVTCTPGAECSQVADCSHNTEECNQTPGVVREKSLGRELKVVREQSAIREKGTGRGQSVVRSRMEEDSTI